MKKILTFALAVTALTACKKNNTDQTPYDSQEVLFSTSALSISKGVTPDYEAAGRKNFFSGDQIGIYMANSGAQINNAAYTFKPGVATGELEEAVNFTYTYAEPYWSPVEVASVTNKLMYPKTQGAKKVQLFAYFPSSNETNSPVALKASPADKGSELVFTLPVNQSTNAACRLADFMCAEATNTNAGFAMSAAPINLAFNHMMTKASFTFKMKNSANAAETRYLRAVVAVGPEMLTEKPAAFDVVLGKLTPAANAAGVSGKVYYFNGAVTPEYSITTPDDASFGDVVDEATKAKTATVDLLFYPFTQTASVNSYLFYFTKDNTTTYADLEALETAAKDKTNTNVEVYSYSIPAAVASTSDVLAAGTANGYVVSMDVDKVSVKVTTSIKEWVTIPGQGIPAE